MAIFAEVSQISADSVGQQGRLGAARFSPPSPQLFLSQWNVGETAEKPGRQETNE
jgi:hypothetical protein